MSDLKSREGGNVLSVCPGERSAAAFSCPWCPTVIFEAGLGSAVTVFELHLDQHYA